MVLVPNSFERFVCDGSICDDLCCEGNWTIFVDKKHYLEWKKNKHPLLRAFSDKYLILNDENNEFSYGIMHMDQEKKACNFLNSQRLCDLQYRYGLGYLCDVCREYPRTNSFLYGNIVRSLTLSCPLACSLLLSEADGISLVDSKADMECSKSYTNFINNQDNGSGNFDNEVPLEILKFSVEIIKNRTKPIWKRLIYLGLFINEIQEAWNMSNIDKLISCFEKYTLQSVEIYQSIDEIDVKENHAEIKKLIIDAVLRLRAEIGIHDEKYIDVINAAVKGFSSYDELDSKSFQSIYDDNKVNGFDKFFLDKEYILENYIVTYIISNCFPFSDGLRAESLFSSYKRLIINYSTLIILLNGILGDCGGVITDGQIYRVFQIYVKTNEHNRFFQDSMVKLLVELQSDTLAHLALLLMEK